MTALGDIACAIEIEATPERVWQVMTTEGLVEEWLGCIGFAAKTGALFYMQPDAGRAAKGDVEGATHCELEALDAPRSMRFSWFLPGFPKTQVELTLTPSGAGTRVELTHSGWAQFDADQIRAIRDMLEGGWRSAVLPGLKRVSERPDA